MADRQLPTRQLKAASESLEGPIDGLYVNNTPNARGGENCAMGDLRHRRIATPRARGI